MQMQPEINVLHDCYLATGGFVKEYIKLVKQLINFQVYVLYTLHTFIPLLCDM